MKEFARTKRGRIVLFCCCLFGMLVSAGCLYMTKALMENAAYTNPALGYVWFMGSGRYVLPSRIMEWTWRSRYVLLLLCPVLLLFTGWAFFWLMAGAGRKNGEDGLFTGFSYPIPWGLVLAGAVFAGGLWQLGTEGLLSGLLTGRTRNFWSLYAAAAGWFAAGLFVCMDAAVRIKGKTLFSNTLTARIIKKIPLVWKTVLIAGILLIIQGCIWNDQMAGFPWLRPLSFFALLAAAVLAVIFAMMQRRLEKAGQALAAGNYDYRTDTAGLAGAYKGHAENLNHVADGMEKAVEERLKSERMKSELITNVTHDLKTPLTSIVNYTALLRAEPCENEKIKEYTDVLQRQSDRLKHLIDDLTEAANASAGTMDVDLSPCDAGVLISQAAGEYEARLEKAGLTLVTKRPEEPVMILADSRRMWRIFDNLLGNICKYALPGTRVYLQLEKADGKAKITFKNTSREPLDFSADELKERFVRGDAARSTEGSGLGLSIAESLAKLQGGTLLLETDGDLFKAMLHFPIAE